LSRPARVGEASKSSITSPGPPARGRRTTTRWLATTAASIPTITTSLLSECTRAPPIVRAVDEQRTRQALSAGRAVHLHERALGRAPSGCLPTPPRRRSRQPVGHPSL